MAAVLPRFIFVKSIDNNKYLCYTKDVGLLHAHLRLSQEAGAEIQCLKFEVEEAKAGNGFVHIRNCYNNKYLVRKSAERSLIVGEANEAEEDQSKWSCTLFKPIFIDSVDEDAEVVDSPSKPLNIRLVHVDQLGEQYVSLSADNESFSLVVGNDENSESSVEGDAFTVYDASEGVILPDFVAFMGYNDKYCAITTANGKPYMEFKATELGATGVIHLVESLPLDRLVVITNKANNKLWALTEPYILADSASTHNGNNRVFTPILLGDNAVALRNWANEKLANVISGEGMSHVLGATTTTIDDYSTLRVVEPVLTRQINDIVYNLDDARIYGVHESTIYSDFRENHTTVPQEASLMISYTNSQTTSWNNSVSIATDVSASWSFQIPYLAEDGIGLSAAQTDSRKWGEEKTSAGDRVEYSMSLTIPPMTRTTLQVVSMKGSCDVPFTYVGRDTMADGSLREYSKTDGLFVGTNNYGFTTRVTQEDL